MKRNLTRLSCACLVIIATSGCSSPTPTPAPTAAPTPSPSTSPWGNLWPGAQPPGTTGHAVLGNNWQVQTLTAYTGVFGAFLYVLGCREPLPGLHERYDFTAGVRAWSYHE